jgi:ATP-dependent DNA ligase
MPVPRQLPSDLAGPVPLAVARAAEVVPAASACAGGCRYEIKWDGYRMAVTRADSAARLWSRRGTDLTSAFPDLAAAAEFHLRPGTVLDGEAVIWADGRLSFDHLQQRLARRESTPTSVVRRRATSRSICWRSTVRIRAASPTALTAPDLNG